MQLTLLEVVQQYLDATSGFYVDSIFDNDEAQQVANVAERIYYEMVQEFPNLLFVQKDVTLDAVGDATKPNFLLIPSTCLLYPSDAADDLLCLDLGGCMSIKNKKH